MKERYAMNMKNLSVAIVITAALAAGAVAQQNKNDKKPPKPTAQKHVTKPAPKAAPKGNSTGVINGHIQAHTTPIVTKPAGQTSHPGGQTTGGSIDLENGKLKQNPQYLNNSGAGQGKGSGMGKGTATPIKATGKPLVGQTLHTGHPVAGKPGVFALKNAPAVQRGVNAPPKSAFAQPSAPVSSHNFPAPHQGNTYITNNTTVINNNYNYDAQRYQPHVSNFSGYQSPGWGGHWRYGVVERPERHTSFGFGFYVYTPFYASCVASPWYYYPGVPACAPSRISISKR